MTTRIYITPLKEDRYQVELEDGTPLLKSTRVPFYASARELEARGVTGQLEMWDRVRPFPRMLGDIVTAAKYTVSETERGLKLIPYRPFAWQPSDQEVASDGPEV